MAGDILCDVVYILVELRSLFFGSVSLAKIIAKGTEPFSSSSKLVHLICLILPDKVFMC